jgi:hypothetical protein
VREVAQKWLDWKTLGPLATQYQALIEPDVKTDAHKLDTIEAFHQGTVDLKTFADERRTYLLANTPAQAPRATGR